MNPFSLWRSWAQPGRDPPGDGPWDMNKTLVDKLVAASELTEEALPVAQGGERAGLRLSFAMPPHSVARIDVRL